MHRVSSITLALLGVAAAGQALASPAPATNDKVTAPEAVLGTRTGSDYYLADYTQISKWLKQAAAESSRMKLVSIGKTAEGREQYMAIVSSPENLARLDHYKDISKKLALAKGLTDDQARSLAKEGKPIVWIDAGLHATEVVNAQTHPQIIHELLTGNDEETLRILGDEIVLFPFANPDGLELVADWYMRPADKAKRNTSTIPTLYQKYIGHDNNRDSYMSAMPETTNMNRAAYREWFPQIIYNEHQTGPVGTVVFIPPFRDYPNFNYDPLVINQTDSLAYAMHGRLIAEGRYGSTMRSGAPYSTWFNGSIRTVGYFHNAMGILTEIIGNPTPMHIPLVPENQLAREDLIAPIAPQEWHFQQSIDYVKSMDRAVMDWASRNAETIQFNRYVMGRNQIRKGGEDSWVITPKRIAAVNDAAKKTEKPEDNGEYRGANVVDSKLYDTVLKDPAQRAPRAFIIPADGQADMPTTIRFLNALIRNGVEVQRADRAFSFGGKNYPAGSFVVRSDQAFRPHVLDMFEPQDHPQDFAYPGGPPVKPYDITGYNLSYQMNVTFDRVLDAFPEQFPAVADELTPPPGHVVGQGGEGFLVSHATNNSFILTNRLMKAKQPVFWLKAPVTAGGQSFGPGTLWIPAAAKAREIVEASVGPLGIDAYAAPKPAGETIALKPVRIGLVDVYGGSMASGWTRWIFEQFEFPYTKVFPQEIDKGGLNKKYDVLVFQTDVLGRESSVRRQPAAADIPAENRPMLGAVTREKSYPQIAAFAKAGGTVVTVGNAGDDMGEALGLPVSNPLTVVGKDGKRKPIPATDYYIPGSILSARFDVTDPLAYGMPERADVFFYNSPVFTLTGDTAKKVAWFDSETPLRSGWAWGQKALKGTTTIVDASLGKGHVFLIGPEVTSRAQPYATFKLLFNGIYYGPARAD
ncbi:MAG: peptidase [Proteobacteria bacterium]|nr:peptidase [Pseudomonadota bacterium]